MVNEESKFNRHTTIMFIIYFTSHIYQADCSHGNSIKTYERALHAIETKSKKF